MKDIKCELNEKKRSKNSFVNEQEKKIVKLNSKDTVSDKKNLVVDLDKIPDIEKDNGEIAISSSSSSSLAVLTPGVYKRAKILPSYSITENRVKEILEFIDDILNSRSKDNGRKFRSAHSFKDFVARPMEFTNVRVSECVTTVPCCIVCQNYINKDEDRVKYSIFHYPDNSQCDTHVYHVDCFLVINAARKADGRPICIATCANAGCKKGKIKTNLQ